MSKLLAVLDEAGFNALEDETLKGLYKFDAESKKAWLQLPEKEAEKLAINLNKRFDNKKAGLDKVHQENAELKKQVEAYEKLGTPEEITEKIESGEPQAVTELVQKHQDEIKRVQKSYDDKIEKLETDYKTADSQLGQSLKQSTISKLVTEFNLDSEVAPHILKDYISVSSDEEGKKKIVVLKDGEPFSITGRDAQPKDLIEHFIENKNYQTMFKANGGGGSGGSNNNNNFSSKTNYSDLDPVDRLNKARGQ